MKKDPIFLTDKERLIVLEAICGTPNTALPDSCRPFEILEPKHSDGASEKHLPVLETNGCHVTVKAGNTLHPMTEEHSIDWICLQTKAGVTMRVNFSHDCEPVAHFTLEKGDAPLAAYVYCNLHGFWKTEA